MISFAQESLQKKLQFTQRSTYAHITSGETTILMVDVVNQDFESNGSTTVQIKANFDVSDVVTLTLPPFLQLEQAKVAFPLKIKGKIPGVVALSLSISSLNDSTVIR